MAEPQLETIFATKPSVAPKSGFPMPAGHQYVLPKKMADIRYARGIARPAAEVYLERLREMGIVGIVVTKDTEKSVRLAANKVGVAVKSEYKRRGED